MTDYSYLREDLLPGQDSKQLRILKKITSHLRRTPGYEDNLKVFRGKGVITAKEVEDTLSLLEAPRPIIGTPAGPEGLKRNEQWTLLLQGWPKDDPEHPSDPAYRMKAAVEKQLAEIVRDDDPQGRERTDELFKLGGDISSLVIGQGIVRPANQESGNSRLAEFYIPLILELQTDVTNPYS